MPAWAIRCSSGLGDSSIMQAANRQSNERRSGLGRAGRSKLAESPWITSCHFVLGRQRCYCGLAGQSLSRLPFGPVAHQGGRGSATPSCRHPFRELPGVPRNTPSGTEASWEYDDRVTRAVMTRAPACSPRKHASSSVSRDVQPAIRVLRGR